ncbi:unnamed protein product [Caenorhabditis bovis]|uniref:DUF19 domain-containing protein n=1 Tax=Caenorhabditis bovis TaxID=2654633 RepID=A0A8S1EWX4_9PELO|nr:unnamed protein product [Caenorhabditis bovis]
MKLAIVLLLIVPLADAMIPYFMDWFLTASCILPQIREQKKCKDYYDLYLKYSREAEKPVTGNFEYDMKRARKTGWACQKTHDCLARLKCPEVDNRHPIKDPNCTDVENSFTPLGKCFGKVLKQGS